MPHKTHKQTPPQIMEGESVGVTMSMNGYPQPFMLSLHATDTDNGTLTWRISLPAQNGIASVSGTGTSIEVNYTPNLDFTGSDSFTVEVSDEAGATDSIVVNVNITSPPEIQEQATTTPEPSTQGIATSTYEPDIVGGGPADPGEYPWQVALVNGTSTDLYGTRFCGGSLIASQWVLTAAHCITGTGGSIIPVGSVDIVAGIYNLVTPATGYQRRDVIQIIRHPSYNDTTYDNDLALLKLNSPVILGGTGETKTAIIPLVPSGIGDLAGINSWVTGWGNTESTPAYPSQLQEVQVPIISNSVCNDITHYNGGITTNMLCAGYDAGGYDSCQGDSGGPLVVSISGQWKLAGIVSWGNGCAEPFKPGVYTRVSQYVNWINANVTIQHCGTIGSEIWSSVDNVHVVTCNVVVPAGATLTIQAGTIIKFYPDTRLTINGKLMVQGSSVPGEVILTSYTDDEYGGDTNQNGASVCSPDNWDGIFFGDTSDDTSLIDHALIRCGGRNGWGYGGANFDNASPTIQNSTFRQNADCAMYADLHSFPTLAGNTYLNNYANALCLLPQSGETIDTNSTWKAIDTSYYLRGNVPVTLGNTLTIDPGVVVKMGNNTRLTINGKLSIAGTAPAPVIMTSYRDDENGIGTNKDTNGDGASVCSPDDWDGIFFGDTSDDTSSINYALVRCGGSGIPSGGVSFDNASPTIQNSTFRQNAYCSLVADLHSFPTLTGNTYLNNIANGFCLYPQAGETIDTNSTWKAIDTSYYLRNDATVTLGSTLTIDPGVVVKFDPSKSLFVNGKLNAAGTDANLVYFTSYRDDTIKGDTNGDGSTVGVSGDWQKIQFNDVSDDTSVIDHAIIRFGGCCSAGGITLLSASPVIQNSTLTQNAFAGITVNSTSFPTLKGLTITNNQRGISMSDSSPLIQDSTISNNQNYGIYASNSTPTLGCNNIYDNGYLSGGKRYYGLYNATPAVLVNAENQWWGSPSGPYHPTLNPSGTGNAVSDGVDFTPFRNSACGTIVSPPEPFNKISPSNGATNQSINPTLGWNSSAGASEYQYCYDTTNDNVCVNWISNGNSTSVTLSNLSPNTTYYWHVRASNSGGTTYSNGSETAYWSFTTGTVPGSFNKLAPANGATNQPTSPI